MFFQKINFALFLTAGAIFCESIAAPSEKIIGGWTTEPGELPYQVSLRVNGNHICGGAIISHLHILTAAHCVEDFVNFPYKFLTVVSGSNHLSHGGQSHNICRVTYHPKYKSGSEFLWHNDIAIITLTKPITFNSFQNTIDLPSGNLSSGSPGMVAGWGLVFSNFRASSNNLQKLPTTVYPASVCQKRFGSPIHKEQICTIQPTGSGVCSGDSGGPLVVNGEIVGIASWVVPCAKGFPDVYTNVFSYKEFIKREMKNC